MAGLVVLAAAPVPVGATTAPAPSAIRRGIKPNHAAPFAALVVKPVSLHSNDHVGVVLTDPKVYLVFWGSQWSSDPAHAAAALQGMFSHLFGASDTWGTILTQYCEGLPVGTTDCGTKGTHIQHPTSSVLGGVWFDKTSAEPTDATYAELGAEAVRAAGHFGNTTQAPNLDAQYVIASPTGTDPDGWLNPTTGYCGYHATDASTYGKLSWTNLPYVPDIGADGGCTSLAKPRLLDGYESTETHEYAESVTEPFYSTGWYSGNYNEIGDLCEYRDSYLTLGGVKYDVQGLWSNSAMKCVTSG
jgi:hypothetical protein